MLLETKPNVIRFQVDHSQAKHALKNLVARLNFPEPLLRAWICATEKALEEIKIRVEATKVGVGVGKIVNQNRVAKHVELEIGEATFSFRRDTDCIAAIAALEMTEN